MNTPDQRTEEALASLTGMKRAGAPQDFAGQVMDRINALARKRRTVPWPTVWMAAAGLALLMGLNVYVVRQAERPGGQLARQDGSKAFGDRYFAPAYSIAPASRP